MTRPRIGNAPSLKNDPRSRVNDGGIGRESIASPLDLDAQGRATIRVGGPLVTTPDGKLDVNVDHGLSVRTGSPQRIVVRTSDTIVVGRDGNLHAAVSPDDILGLRDFVRGIVAQSGVDISYAEPIVADAYTDPEAPFLYSEDGTDVLVSEVIH